jgi:rfaE bifunctional protein nucleotidyltransferase chain/domain
MPEMERVEVLESLRFVDATVIFDEATPHELIETLQPDVLVKGADWAEDAIVGRAIVEARGGRVVRARVEPGYSTTSIISKVRS